MSSSPRGLALIINNIEFTIPEIYPFRWEKMFFCGRYQNLCFPEEKEPRWTLKTLQSFSLSWVSRWIFLKGHSSDHSTLKVILPQIEWVLTSDFYRLHIFIILSKRWKNTWTLEGPKRSGFWSTLLRGLNTKMPTWSSCFTSSTLQIMSDQATSEVFQNKIFISGDSLYTFPRHSPRPVRRKKKKKVFLNFSTQGRRCWLSGAGSRGGYSQVQKVQKVQKVWTGQKYPTASSSLSPSYIKR